MTNKTLLELLVDKLPGEGGWPDGYYFSAQDVRFSDGTIIFYKNAPSQPIRIGVGEYWQESLPNDMSSLEIYTEQASDWATALITRTQYEKALAAKNAQAVQAWSGEGIPPVGTVCEMLDGTGTKWLRVEIISNHDGFACGWFSDYGVKMPYFSDKPNDFRPAPPLSK